MRLVGLALVVGIAAVCAACSSLNHESVQFRVDNRTESVVCLYPSVPDAAGGRCLMEVKPGTDAGWGLGCAYGKNADEAPVTVAITVKEGGRPIYDRTAECLVWQRSERRFIIEQRGDEFVVTDPLPKEPR
jgi:hypothetical protein